MAFRDPYSYVAEFTGANVVPASGSIIVPVNIDREADFELYRVAMLATSVNFRAQLRDQDDRLLVGGVGTAVTLFGGGQRPFRWRGARIIKRTNQIRSALTDASAAPNTVRLLYTGAQVFPNPPMEIPPFKWAEPFSLFANFGAEATDDAAAVPASGSAEFTRRVPGDSWFEVHELCIMRTGQATLQILTDGFREWFRVPVHVDLLGACDPTGAGATATLGTLNAQNPSAEWPFEFTPPKLMVVNHGITFRLSDLSAAPNPIRIAVHGMRRYPG